MFGQVEINLDCRRAILATRSQTPTKNYHESTARMRGGNQPRLPAVGFANACAS